MARAETKAKAKQLPSQHRMTPMPQNAPHSEPGDHGEAIQTKRRVGRPSAYPETQKALVDLAERILALADDGKSITQISADLNVPRQTLQNWARDHEEFAAILARARELELPRRPLAWPYLRQYSRARELELAWWESKGQENLGSREFNAALWMKSVSARFKGDYGEKIQTELTGKDGKDLIPEKRDDLELARFFAGILTNAAKQQESQE